LNIFLIQIRKKGLVGFVDVLPPIPDIGLINAEVASNGDIIIKECS
jgi:hypothetical protein